MALFIICAITILINSLHILRKNNNSKHINYLALGFSFGALTCYIINQFI